MAGMLLVGTLGAWGWHLWGGVRGGLPEVLTAQPGRAGKIGTLRALEVGAQARRVAREVAAPRLAACDPGWMPGEPVALASTLTLRASQGKLERRWEETLSYREDAAGRGELTIDATSADVLDVPLTHSRRWTWTPGEALEWVGPSSAVEHPVTSPALARARQDAHGKLESLMRTLAEGWAPTSESTLTPQQGAGYRCGQRAALPGEDWASLLRARADLRTASVDVERRGEARCQILRASLSLAQGGELELGLETCTRAGPEQVSIEAPERRTSLDVLNGQRELRRVETWFRERIAAGELEAGPGLAVENEE
ncbi:hypothetical protein EA187_13795 [Lujinxingia sediminis]|uniref:DUF4340 domain-containing protein n=1 Tax=Lujinxingia sediminis TaxID=2480984 RepID=A0ABY0CQW1_9DELT|nr:hypothetical protein [Lujinxingia sediminis]RVU42906.1 hypothetical protein EA187_13795 [Lujinxingia sediminis]